MCSQIKLAAQKKRRNSQTKADAFAGQVRLLFAGRARGLTRLQALAEKEANLKAQLSAKVAGARSRLFWLLMRASASP